MCSDEKAREDQPSPAARKSQGFYDVSGSLDYTYDLNGNLTADKNKDISLIKYNYLNLPEKIVNQTDINKTIEYIYSADGQKLMKKSPDNIKTYYSGSFVYETASGATTLKYIIHPEGMITMSSTPEYQYYLKDHLGNVRMVVNSSNVTTQITNYYSFGLSSESYASGFDNKYLYNGKELQEDGFNSNSSLGWYDYGARFYDPQIGRWTTPDPLEQYVCFYIFNGNNPLNSIDQDGKWCDNFVQDIEQAVVNSQGQIIYWNPNDKDKNIYLSPDGVQGSDGNTTGLRKVGEEDPNVDYSKGLYWYGFHGTNTTGYFPFWMLQGDAIDVDYTLESFFIPVFGWLKYLKAPATGIMYKISLKISKQLAQRGWSEEALMKLLDNPYTKRAAQNKATQNAATALFNKDGSHIVVDDVTKEIIQVSNRNDFGWVPDQTIKNPYIPNK
jgi:RHS repeat-associated protein